MKICFLGLSRSGKTCYLYAASNVLSEGINTDYGTVSIMSTNEQQNIRLNEGIEDMERGVWPRGSNQTMVFPFDFLINGRFKCPFEIYDYRGGALYDARDKAQDERKELYETFNDTSCVVIFIDAYTLIDAFELKNPEDDAAIHQKGSTEKMSLLSARNRIKHLELIVSKCHEISGQNIPVLLTITKKDILTPEELERGIEGLRRILPTIFSREKKMTIGITAVSLGENLGAGEADEEQRKRLTGHLMLDVSQNLHIPILFALFLGINTSDNEKKIAMRIFNNDVVKLFIGGERAIFMP